MIDVSGSSAATHPMDNQGGGKDTMIAGTQIPDSTTCENLARTGQTWTNFFTYFDDDDDGTTGDGNYQDEQDIYWDSSTNQTYNIQVIDFVILVGDDDYNTPKNAQTDTTLKYYNAATAGWDDGEDIIWEDFSNNGVFNYVPADQIIYDSGDGVQDTNRFLASTDSRLAYDDKDSDNLWDNGEDIVLDSDTSGTFDGPVSSSTPYSALYKYDCSECHYDSGGTAGEGTYGSSKHVETNIDVAFDSTSNGIATYDGDTTIAAAVTFNSTQNTCKVYCHSTAWMYQDGAGTAIYTPGSLRYSSPWPDWDDSSSVSCGNCHEAVGVDYDNDATPEVYTAAGRPNTGGHTKAAHLDDKTNPLPCNLCHYNSTAFSAGDYDWETYGHVEHSDGQMLICAYSGGTVRTDTTQGYSFGKATCHQSSSWLNTDEPANGGC
jgi:hypothetical protein